MGVGVSAVVPLIWGLLPAVPSIVNSGAFFGGCERCFVVSWIICQHGGKFGSQSILRLHNRCVGFVVGLGFPVGGLVGVLVGCWHSLGLTASNCGKGLPKVLQQLRQRWRLGGCRFSGALVTVAGLDGGARFCPGFRRLARWLSAGGCPSCCPCSAVALSAGGAV